MTPRFAALFWRQVVRHSWRHPLLTSLNIASVALGVAVFLAIQLANDAALDSFRSSASLATGRADLEVRGRLEETLLPAVQAIPGVRLATPLVEGLALVPDMPGEYLRILGVDPLSGRDVFAFELDSVGGKTLDIEAWLSDPDGVAVQTGDTGVLNRMLREGELPVLAGSARRTLHPRFIFKPDGTPAQIDPRIAAMDIGWAQELLGQTGHLTSILILLNDPAQTEAVASRIRQIVPGDAVVAPPRTRSQEMKTMLGAFQLNLTAMSLVSIIVGMLLIYNSVSAAVVRRRPEIAILRAVGATRLEIRLLFLCEALLEALIGSTLGILLAPLLTTLVAAPIEQSISSLYELVRLGNYGLEPRQIAEAFTLGILAALAAAWQPASEAARSKPAAILHPGAALEQLTPIRPRYLVFAAAFLTMAWLLSAMALQGGPRWMGFASAAAVLAGFSLLVPWLAVAIAGGFRHGGVLLRLSANHLVRALHRNAVTIVSLAAAVAMTISVTVMIHSFRESVGRWITKTLVADLYISPAANDIAGFQVFLPEDATTWLGRQPGVRAISGFREIPIRLQDQPVTLTAVEGKARGDLEFLEGSSPRAAEEFASGHAVAVSESLASRFPVRSGSTIELPTPAGSRVFTVCGVYRDYSNERGTVMMQDSLFRRYWKEPRWHSIGVSLEDARMAGALGDRFRETFGKDGQFVIYDNAALRRRVFDIFDQTFAVTSVLRGVAVLVAVIGVLFSLSVLVLEREREIGVLRALGASRWQVLGIFLGEAFLIGVTACLSGLASGGFLSMVLTWVINKSFFGWTIQLAYPMAALLATPLWLVPAALVAALLPAWRAAQIAPAKAVRFE